MSDPFASHSRGLTSPGVAHGVITPNNSADLNPRPRVLCILTSGNLRLRDAAGVEVTYPVTAGQVLPFSPVRVMSTGTTATCVGWL